MKITDPLLNCTTVYDHLQFNPKHVLNDNRHGIVVINLFEEKRKSYKDIFIQELNVMLFIQTWQKPLIVLITM